MNCDFCPLKAFRLLDSRGVSAIDAYDVVNLLRRNYITVTLVDAQAIILEYADKNTTELTY